MGILQSYTDLIYMYSVYWISSSQGYLSFGGNTLYSIPLLHLRGQFCKDQSRANKQVVDEKIRDSLHFFEAWA